MTITKNNKDKKTAEKLKKRLDKKIKRLENSFNDLKLKNEIISKDFEELNKQKDSLKEKNVRLLAEFENYKRRKEDEILNLFKYTNEKLVKDLFPVLDDLKRALESTSGESENPIITGLKSVREKINNVLVKHGIESFDSIGMKFDPNKHDALLNRESEADDGVILEEFEQGFKYHDRIVRHAKVVVSKKNKVKK